jgi:hypothetical protein
MHFYLKLQHDLCSSCGRSLSPAFGVEILEPSGKFVLLLNKLEKFHDQPIDPIETIARIVQSSAGDLWQIVNRL